MTGLFEQPEPEGATPIPAEEKANLIPSWIATRDELNGAEQANIFEAVAWAGNRKLKPETITSDRFARTLHKAMFGDVWKWAGKYRTVELTIGVEPWKVANECAVLFDNFKYWAQNGTHPPDELAVMFHHKLVFVHPYQNGNGRHSRLMADLLVESLGGKPFSWGRGNLQTTGDLRKAYIATLKKADKGEMDDLLAFARS